MEDWISLSVTRWSTIDERCSIVSSVKRNRFQGHQTMRVLSGDGVSHVRLVIVSWAQTLRRYTDINTTPPTPDMYYASRPQKATRRESSDHTALTTQSSESVTSSGISSSQSPGAAGFTMPKYLPNPVFREMQDKNKSVPMDWPTVPL
jgi:hypothetical protein